jgi:NADH-quinone oxidoreductase subunit L
VWLPDAMAGPDAGVGADPRGDDGDRRRLSRRADVRRLRHAPEASRPHRGDRAATAFFAATIAVVQTDIKKVLAYSTISQLGFMFVAAGVGAYGVAVFHLYTHAFFKACLFLGAGSVIHAMSGEQDIRKMGGLARKIP